MAVVKATVCQLSSIPGATAQLIACTWITKVFVLTLLAAPWPTHGLMSERTCVQGSNLSLHWEISVTGLLQVVKPQKRQICFSMFVNQIETSTLTACVKICGIIAVCRS